MKLFTYFIRYASLSLLLANTAYARMAAPEKITLSEEDIATLEAMGFSRAEAQETAQLINNMSPDEQNALAQIGQQVAQDMTKSGLDPNDPEAMVNFLSKQESKPMPMPEPMPMQPRRDERPFGPSPQEIPDSISAASENKIAAPVKNPLATGDISLIIKEILKHLASLRQKRQTSDRLTKFSNELDALSFNLDFINRPELFSYITSQEFSHLYAILEHLHRTILTYEPRITAFPFFEEDEIENPYESLQLPINARAKDIEAAYRKLKQKHDPEILSKTEQIRNLRKKERERVLTEAKLAFIEIKAAYESLKNPKEKAAIDKALAEYHALEEKNEQLSDSAFDTLIEIIENLIFRQHLLKDIGALLKKYAPEEKKKLDQWEKHKQVALEASKKEYESAVSRGKSQKTISISPREEIGEKYWREFRVAETPSRGFPSLSSEPYQEPKLPRGFEPETPKDKKSEGALGSKPKEGEKESKDKDKDKEKDKKEDDKTKAPKQEKKEEEVNDLELDEYTALLNNSHLKTIKKEVDAHRSAPESLAYALNVDLPGYLAKAIAPAPKPAAGDAAPATLPTDLNPALKRIEQFIKKSKLDKISNDLTELSAKIKDTKKPALKSKIKDRWQQFLTQHKGTIDKLHEIVSDFLHPKTAQNKGITIDPTVEEFELLNTENNEAQQKTMKELLEAGTGFAPGQRGFLGNFVMLVNNLKENTKRISKELGVSDKAAASGKK